MPAQSVQPPTDRREERYAPEAGHRCLPRARTIALREPAREQLHAHAKRVQIIGHSRIGEGAESGIGSGQGRAGSFGLAREVGQLAEAPHVDPRELLVARCAVAT